tara:strand:+ start:679 stop:1185 length:507 start_codon:yes stop_codon:yes gene_type:complete
MSKWIQDSSWKRGQGVEAMFAKLLNERATEARAADLMEQFSHVDYVSDFGKIDVKARKRVARKDDDVQDDLVWLEFKNVQGKFGWLYGKADWIAFERLLDFVLVKRHDLALMGEKLCDLGDRVAVGKDALYKGYQRRGRKDLLSIVKMTDVLALYHQLWAKDVDTDEQ